MLAIFNDSLEGGQPTTQTLDATVMAKAFSRGALLQVWGCNANYGYLAVMNALAKYFQGGATGELVVPLGGKAQNSVGGFPKVWKNALTTDANKGTAHFTLPHASIEDAVDGLISRHFLYKVPQKLGIQGWGTLPGTGTGFLGDFKRPAVQESYCRWVQTLSQHLFGPNDLPPDRQDWKSYRITRDIKVKNGQHRKTVSKRFLVGRGYLRLDLVPTLR